MNNKKIIFYVTKKYMRHNPRRTAVTFIGIVFMVMLMTCVFVGRDSVMGYLYDVAVCDKGSWHVMTYDITEEQAEQIEQLPEVDRMARTCSLGNISFPQSGSDIMPYLFVKGYSPETFGMVNMFPVQGRLPKDKNEIVISSLALELGSDIAVGDKISGQFLDRFLTSKATDGGTFFPAHNIELKAGETIALPEDFPFFDETDSFREYTAPTGRSAEFTVVGFVKQPFFETGSSGGFSAFTVFDSSADKCGAIIELDLSKAGSSGSFTRKIRSIAGEDTQVDTNEMLLAFSAKGSDAVLNNITIFIQVFFIVLIMAASVILIYNVFNMSLAERTKYLGMLSSVGATRRQKRASIYYEAFSLLIPAVPAGILLGIGIIKAAMLLLKPQLAIIVDSIAVGADTSIPVRLAVSPLNIIFVAAFSVLTVLISSFIPAVRIGRIGPIESIRGNELRSKKHSKTCFSLMKKNRAELLLAVNSTSRCRSLTKGIVRSIAAFAVLAAVTLYGAFSVNKIVEMKLSEDDMGFIGISEEYEYSASAFSREDFDSIYDLISSSDEVDKLRVLRTDVLSLQYNAGLRSDEYNDALRSIYRQFFDSDDDPEYISIVSKLDDPEYTDLLNVIVLSDDEYAMVAEKAGADMKTVNDTSLPSVLIYNKAELTTDQLGVFGRKADYKYAAVENVFNVRVGDTFPVSVNSKEFVNLTVAGFADNDALDGLYRISRNYIPWIILNEAGFRACDEMFRNYDRNRSFIDQVVVFSVKDNASGRLVEQLRGLSAKEENGISFSKPAELIAKSVKIAITRIISILAGCFTVLVSVVCLMNLYNSVKSRAVERKRENAVLSSLGMDGRQMRKMFMLENLILLARGLAAAAVIAAACMLFFNKMITGYFGNIRLDIPWLIIALVVIVICAAVILFTALCYKNNNAESVVETVRNETV